MVKLVKLTFAVTTGVVVVLSFGNFQSTAPAVLAGHCTLLAADPVDPGKDITPDPHDEIHDPDLPANNPDKYLSK